MLINKIIVVGKRKIYEQFIKNHYINNESLFAMPPSQVMQLVFFLNCCWWSWCCKLYLLSLDDKKNIFGFNKIMLHRILQLKPLNYFIKNVTVDLFEETVILVLHQDSLIWQRWIILFAVTWKLSCVKTIHDKFLS